MEAWSSGELSKCRVVLVGSCTKWGFVLIFWWGDVFLGLICDVVVQWGDVLEH